MPHISTFVIALLLAFIVGTAFVNARHRNKPRGNQLQAVTHPNVTWKATRVLNRPETAVYAAATATIAEIEPTWRIWPQVSLGEILETEGRSYADQQAYRWINSKRADFLIVNSDGWPLAVLEYQGEGHYQGNAEERDSVKRAVLPRAGILYIEIAARLARRQTELDTHLRTELAALRSPEKRPESALPGVAE